VIDEQDKRLFDKRLNNDLSATLEVLSPFRESLHSVAVESTFNWYWLVDGLQEAGFKVQLVNTAAVGQYDGLKYSGDHQDAFHLAHLMRLGILPTGYIYPKAQRAVRDLLRRRLSLVRAASTQLISVQSQIWRSTGVRINSGSSARSALLLPHWTATHNRPLPPDWPSTKPCNSKSAPWRGLRLKPCNSKTPIKSCKALPALAKYSDSPSCSRPVTFTALRVLATTHPIVAVSIPSASAMAKRKVEVTPKRVTNTCHGRSPKRPILRSVLNPWRNASMSAKRPRPMA